MPLTKEQKAALVVPRVGINGTSREELIRLYQAVLDQLGPAQDALTEAAPHGRDYQTVEGYVYAKAVAQHNNRRLMLHQIIDELEHIVEGLIK